MSVCFICGDPERGYLREGGGNVPICARCREREGIIKGHPAGQASASPPLRLVRPVYEDDDDSPIPEDATKAMADYKGGWNGTQPTEWDRDRGAS